MDNLNDQSKIIPLNGHNPNSGLPPSNMRDIEALFDHYCKIMNVDQRTLLPFQLQAMRKMFYAGITSILTLQRDVISKMDENAAADAMQNLLDQCETFFLHTP